jgi:multidrug resistance protein
MDFQRSESESESSEKQEPKVFYNTSTDLEKSDVEELTRDSTDSEGIRRTETRNTIITTLERRVNKTWNDAESFKDYHDLASTEDALPTKNDGVEFQEIDPELITWDGDDDPENPKNWAPIRKWKTVSALAMYTFLSPFASTMMSPAVELISKEFKITSTIVSSMMVSIYLLAFTIFSPLVAPLSEMYGRKLVLDVSVWILFAFNLGCAFSTDPVQMCILRFLAGLGGSAPICIGLGVLSDMFDTKDIALANSIYALGPVIGPCVSALIAGIIVDHVDWRWCFYVLSIINGIAAVSGNFILEETYAPTILNKKSKRLRKQTGNTNLKSIYEIVTGETKWEKLSINLQRPWEMLFTNPMVFGLGIFMAITYGCLYIMIVTFPTVWRHIYGMSLTQVGLMYISLLIGYVAATVLNPSISGYFCGILKRRNNGIATPEHRLIIMLQAGILIPIALFWYGWGAEKKMHYIFTAAGTTIFGFSLILVFFSISLYLIEMNPRFAASSLAATSVFRSLLAFCFPLFAPKLYSSLGYGWGCSLFGFIALATGIPFPVFLVYYGQSMRERTNRKMEIKQAKRDAKYLNRLKYRKEQDLQNHSEMSSV